MGPVQRFTPQTGQEIWHIGFANGFVIDTRGKEPALPPALRIIESSDAPQYYIIQFTGPLQNRWQKELAQHGIRTFGYLPNYAVIAKLTPEQRRLVAQLAMVRWVGLFQPAYKLQDVLLNATGIKELTIQVTPGEDAEPVSTLIQARGGIVHDVLVTSFATTIRATLAADHIPEIARLQEVIWIQEWTEPTICNNQCQWVVQTGWKSTAQPDTALAVRTAWKNGVRGQGVILSTTDTGLNTGHNMFRDPSLPITPPGIWPNHRKVVAFKLYQGASSGESPYHGSHVNGTVAGDDSITGGTSYYDGMALKARLYFVDLTSSTGGFVIGNDLTPLWDSVYLGRGLPDSLRPITQHSGSWGWSNSSGTYLIQDASTDNYCWQHKDFLCIMAAGNESSTRRIRNPGIAKDVLTVGADSNGTAANKIASFSSRGPTQDGRLKPNVMAPGTDLWSALNTGQSGYDQMSGTSMATPAVSGALGLVRCYLRAGYYPTGTPEPGNRIQYISAALMRSLAIVSADPNIGSYVVPSNDIGWGRIDIDSVLYFTGDQRKLLLCDDTLGLATGEYKEARFHVTATIPLRVSLAWSDTAAAPNANPTLVNNLNLELTSPTGTNYHGNKYTGGQSQANPTGWDTVNTEECCRINAPDTGLWTIRVYGQNIATRTRQPFAWAITGAVEPYVLTHDVGVSAILAPVGQIDSGTVIVPRVVVENFGLVAESLTVTFAIDTSYLDSQWVSLPVAGLDTVTFTPWVAQPVGHHLATCTTLLPGDQNPANDIAADSFEVIPSVGLAGETGLPTAYSLERVRPNPFTARTAFRYALPRASQVTLAIYDVTGSLVKTLRSGIEQPGWHTIVWDGQDANGRAVGHGIYYCRLTADRFSATEKLVKLE